MPVRIALGLAVTALALAIAGHRFWYISRLVRAGQPADRRIGRSRVEAELVEVGGQRKLLQWTVPGLAHAFTFWGFTVLILTIIEAYGDLFDKNFAIWGIGHNPVLGFIEDLFISAVLLALVVFSIIRLTSDPKRLERRSRFYGSHTGAAWITLALIAAVMITLLLYRAAQTNTGDFPYTWWAFLSHAVGRALHPLGSGVNSVLETVFVILNIAVITGFLVFLSYSKHMHIATAPFNVATSRRPRALGALDRTPDMDMENVSEETVFGVGLIDHTTWKQRLDFVTCTECGRCQSACPAWNTDKPLSPKLVIMDLRDNMFANADRVLGKEGKNGDGAGEPETLVPNTIDPDVLWSCTTCGACVQECPVDIEHVDTIVDMRRYEVLMESRFPSEAGLMLRNIENQGDPWGLGQSRRTEWTQALDFDVPVVTDTVPENVEYLYWVGCAGALDERARKGAQATARMLHRAGVSFAILGPKESCTGDPARRLGNEYLYQEQGKANVATLKDAGAKKVIASCPHCFNTIKNEYPALGADFEVIHHSQLLAHLVEAGKLVPGDGYKGTVTYHDPCYLGRHNRVFDQPRSIIESIPGAENVEMHRCRERGFCCGAGGARMWLEERIGKRVNIERTEEALGTGADVVSTACPYCMIMLDDAVRAKQREEEVRVLDVSQLVEESLEEKRETAGTAETARTAGTAKPTNQERTSP